MKKMVALALLILLVLIVAVRSIPSVRAWIAVDRCLDSGGSYDYEAHRCDFEISHPGPGRAS